QAEGDSRGRDYSTAVPISAALNVMFASDVFETDSDTSWLICAVSRLRSTPTPSSVKVRPGTGFEVGNILFLPTLMSLVRAEPASSIGITRRRPRNGTCGWAEIVAVVPALIVVVGKPSGYSRDLVA